jgi:acylphosphatase
VTKRVHLIISGYVQGVFFRASSAQAARKLHLCGWVRNLPDGRVELLAEGEDSMLDRMIEWCRRGPPGARVDDISIEWSGELSGWTEFQIR